MKMPDAHEIKDIVSTALDRLWGRQPLLFAAPSAILGLNTIFESVVAPRHELLLWPVLAIKAALWSTYGLAVTRAWSRRRPPLPTKVVLAVAATLVTVATTLYSWAGALLLLLFCLTPTLEAVAITDWAPGRALDVGMTLGLREPARWAAVISGAGLLLGFVWLIINGIGSALVPTPFTAFGDLLAGLVIGPFLHLFFGLRCGLFEQLAQPYFEDLDA
jgi:hypothetical protein